MLRAACALSEVHIYLCSQAEYRESRTQREISLVFTGRFIKSDVGLHLQTTRPLRRPSSSGRGQSFRGQPEGNRKLRISIRSSDIGTQLPVAVDRESAYVRDDVYSCDR